MLLRGRVLSTLRGVVSSTSISSSSGRGGCIYFSSMGRSSSRSSGDGGRNGSHFGGTTGSSIPAMGGLGGSCRRRKRADMGQWSSTLRFSAEAGSRHKHCDHSHDGGAEQEESSAAPVEKDRPCWNCGMAVYCSKLFCNSCDSVQPMASTTNYYDVLGCPMSVWVDQNAIETRFKTLQKQLHPDLHSRKSEEDRALSTANSAVVNQAYQTLKDPLERVRHLLKLIGITALEEDSRETVDGAFLMQVMETREELEQEDVTAEQVEDILTCNGHEIKACLKDLEDNLTRGNVDNITKAAIRLQYLSKIREEAERVRTVLRDAAERSM